jgi:hypothetical protein
VGVKVTLTLQVAPAESVPPQVLVSLKAPLVGLMAMFERVMSLDPTLVSVTVCGVLATPRLTVPKSMLVGDATKVVLSNAEMAFASTSATAKSIEPVPVKSAAASETGSRPAGKLSALWKVASPLPSRTQTLPRLSSVANARSRMPSPLKSAATSASGSVPAV